MKTPQKKENSTCRETVHLWENVSLPQVFHRKFTQHGTKNANLFIYNKLGIRENFRTNFLHYKELHSNYVKRQNSTIHISGKIRPICTHVY